MSGLPPPRPPTIGASSLMTCPAGTRLSKSGEVRTMSETLPSTLRPRTTTPDPDSRQQSIGKLPHARRIKTARFARQNFDAARDLARFISVCRPAPTAPVANLQTKLVRFAPRLLQFFLKTLDRRRNLRARSAKLACDLIHERLRLLKTREGIRARDGAYAARAGSDGFVAGDLEQADVARRANVRAAAKLFREDPGADTSTRAPSRHTFRRTAPSRPTASPLPSENISV